MRGGGLLAAALVGLVVNAACHLAGSPVPGVVAHNTPVPTFVEGQPLGAEPAVPKGWRRPTDVGPAAEEGTFKVISSSAEIAPVRVRVFFLGTMY